MRAMKKFLAIISVMLPFVGVGLFSNTKDSFVCKEESGVQKTEAFHAEIQSEKPIRVYQVWCGGIF